MEINVDGQRKVTLSSANVNILVRKYKDYLLPLGVIVASFIILFFIVIPEIQNYFNSRAQLETETQKLNTLKNNYNFLSNLDESQVDKDIKTLSFALPSGKDFVGILNAISAASSKTGAGIGNYEFSPGNLTKETGGEATQFPSIKIEINVGANATSVVKFIQELYKTAPVSEVKSIKTTNNISALIIVFYYKPYPPQNVSDESPVSPLSSKNQSLLKEINGWNNITESTIDFLSLPASGSSQLTSTQSGGINPSPF